MGVKKLETTGRDELGADATQDGALRPITEWTPVQEFSTLDHRTTLEWMDVEVACYASGNTVRPDRSSQDE